MNRPHYLCSRSASFVQVHPLLSTRKDRVSKNEVSVGFRAPVLELSCMALGKSLDDTLSRIYDISILTSTEHLLLQFRVSNGDYPTLLK